MMLMAYLSYMLAEKVRGSQPNLLLIMHSLVMLMLMYYWMDHRHAFATLSFIFETFLFLYVGMDALDIEKWKIVGQTYRHTLSLFLSLHCSTRRSFFWICIFYHVQPGKVYRFEQHHFSLGAGFKSCFCFPTILSIKFDQKTPNGKISFRQQVSL
ncbi:Sodium/hydrogen exchanger 2 [Zea mays]|uniref:Sodium/hydrogen exchanger 2 n=1 Tax=Zea mays TaxID=4577 RepID=A0A1D6JUD4_MAIZE|nr:Sodium/hydrogen exchanger 2 [Zea mays]